MNNIKETLNNQLIELNDQKVYNLTSYFKHIIGYNNELVKLTVRGNNITITGLTENFRSCQINFRERYDFSNREYKYILELKTLQVTLSKDDEHYNEYMEVLKVQSIILQNLNEIENIFIQFEKTVKPIQEQYYEIIDEEKRIIREKKELEKENYFNELSEYLVKDNLLVEKGHRRNSYYLLDKITEKSVLCYEVDFDYINGNKVHKNWERKRLKRSEVINGLKNRNYSISSSLIEII